MEENRNKNMLIVVLIVIIIMLISLLTYVIINDKEKKNSDNSSANNDSNITENSNISNNEENNVNNNNSTTNSSINSNWIDYILSSNITSIKLSRMRKIEFGDKEDINKNINITKDELKDLLSNLKESKLTKVYSLGIGGPISDELVVTYGNNYKFEIRYGLIFIDENDTKINELFNKNNYEEKDVENKNSEGSFYFYSINNYSSNMFDKYYK